jgi:hypothetical protein
VTEERKFAILFAATILAARKLIDMDPNKPNMAKGFLLCSYTSKLPISKSPRLESDRTRSNVDIYEFK